MTLRLGLTTAGADGPAIIELVREAERLGFDSTWCGESYGVDAVTRLAWLGGQTTRIKLGSSILQVPARSPAMTAMTAMTLDQLTGGRFILGLGPSGPQVVEGWYGVPYGKPLTRMRECVAIVRAVLAREAPLTHQGEHYQIPYTGPGSTGLGKPLKSILHGRRDMRIYTAAISPAGLACAGEVGDGVLPLLMDPERSDLIEPHVRAGMQRAGRTADFRKFDIAPFVPVVVGDDLDACRQPVKEWLALYIGGMGARSRNFYNDYAVRLGYERDAAAIQDLYLGGKKLEAAAAVPDRLVDTVALVGPAPRIRDRLEAWKAAARRGSVGTMILMKADVAALRLVAECM
ncbi:MAG TPA: LLM class F420-dependent oxidoreductase [Burkholderiales bacterium]|nr:LLM class F420-dependent oxidoreductase [Burkholderiales bacterium]